MNTKKIVFILFLMTINGIVFGQKQHQKISYKDDFNGDTKNWVAEFENPKTSSLQIIDGKLDVSSSAGATIWFENKLSGNIMITYHAMVVDKGGKTDRVSDLNAFWMASNPANENLFTQNGKFTSYDGLHLYYAGVGGHDNSKTRFRKYEGESGKEIQKEYLDQPHLISGNKDYFIKIIVKNGLTQYFLNGELYWEFKDKTPYTTGYFGFRTTKSHQIFDDFKVYKIK